MVYLDDAMRVYDPNGAARTHVDFSPCHRLTPDHRLHGSVLARTHAAGFLALLHACMAKAFAKNQSASALASDTDSRWDNASCHL